jgi:hypothetical protein
MDTGQDYRLQVVQSLSKALQVNNKVIMTIGHQWISKK